MQYLKKFAFFQKKKKKESINLIISADFNKLEIYYKNIIKSYPEVLLVLIELINYLTFFFIYYSLFFSSSYLLFRLHVVGCAVGRFDASVPQVYHLYSLLLLSL